MAILLNSSHMFIFSQKWDHPVPAVLFSYSLLQLPFSWSPCGRPLVYLINVLLLTGYQTQEAAPRGAWLSPGCTLTAPTVWCSLVFSWVGHECPCDLWGIGGVCQTGDSLGLDVSANGAEDASWCWVARPCLEHHPMSLWSESTVTLWSAVLTTATPLQFFDTHSPRCPQVTDKFLSRNCRN